MAEIGEPRRIIHIPEPERRQTPTVQPAPAPAEPAEPAVPAEPEKVPA